MGRYTVTEMHEVDLATLKAENAAAEVAQQAAILWKRMQQPTASVQRGGKSKRSSGGGHGTSRGSTGKGRGGPGASSSSSSSSTCPTAVGMASVLGPSSDSFGCDDCSASEGDISCDSETKEALEDWRRAACIEELQAKLSGHTAELERLDNLSGSLVDNVERNDKSFPRGHVTRPGRLRRGANWGPWHIAPIFSKRSRGKIIAYGGVCVVATSTKARNLADSNAKSIYRLEPQRKTRLRRVRLGDLSRSGLSSAGMCCLLTQSGATM